MKSKVNKRQKQDKICRPVSFKCFWFENVITLVNSNDSLSLSLALETARGFCGLRDV